MSAGEASTIRNAKVGLVSKDLSTLTVAGAKLQDCKYDVSAFQKKSEFGPGTLVITGLEGKNAGEHLVERGSSATVNGEKLAPNVRDVIPVLYPTD